MRPPRPRPTAKLSVLDRDPVAGTVTVRGAKGAVYTIPTEESALTKKRRDRIGYQDVVENSLFSSRFRNAPPVFYGCPDAWAGRPPAIPWAKMKIGDVVWFPVNPAENYWRQWCRWKFTRHQRQRVLKRTFNLYHGKIAFAVLRVA